MLLCRRCAAETAAFGSLVMQARRAQREGGGCVLPRRTFQSFLHGCPFLTCSLIALAVIARHRWPNRCRLLAFKAPLPAWLAVKRPAHGCVPASKCLLAAVQLWAVHHLPLLAFLSAVSKIAATACKFPPYQC